MCSKRVFSSDNLGIDYINYNKLKNGCEILKSIKSEDNLAILDKFKNYNTRQTLNNAYFKYINNNDVEVQYVKNIYSANQSFIDKKCEPNEESFGICSANNEYLYPYGNIVKKRQISPSYSTKIYLCKWCNNKTSINHAIPDCKPAKNDDNECKKCICVNRKPLFI